MNKLKPFKLLAVTTHNVYLVDEVKVRCLADENYSQGSLYGLTWTKDKVIVGGGEHLYVMNPEDFSLEKLGNYRGSGLHQIACYDEKIYACSTNFNFLDVVSNEGKRLGVHSWVKGPPKDYEHINSIYKHEDKFYLCHHNHKTPSFITVFDSNFNILKKIKKIGGQNHNICIYDNKLFTLNSICGIMMVVDLESDNRAAVGFDISLDVLKGKRYFLRGLAKTKDYIFIGLSKNGSVRGDRDANPSWMIILDNEYTVVRLVAFPLPSQIKELRVISEYDYGHRNENKFPYRNFFDL